MSDAYLGLIEELPTTVAYTLAAAAGSYSISGVAATLSTQRKLSAVVGSYAITGVAASLSTQRNLTAVVGSYSISGNVATLSSTAATVVTVDKSDGVGGRKKRRRPLVLGKPYDELIQAKRDKEAQDLEDLQAILENRPARILKPVLVKQTKAQQERAQKRIQIVDDDDEDIEFLLLYG